MNKGNGALELVDVAGWKSLMGYYDSVEGICPVAHTYVTAHIGVLLDRQGGFLCAMDCRFAHELVAVPCTVESGARTSGIAPHLISDNLSYVGNLPGYEKRFGAYREQLGKYVGETAGDRYAEAVYEYIKRGNVLEDIKGLLDGTGNGMEKVNIIFCVSGMAGNEGTDRMWTKHYLESLPKNGTCIITGKPDHIPKAYPAGILENGGKERLFTDGSGVGYVASQKILHALQYMNFAAKNREHAKKAYANTGTGHVCAGAETGE